MPRLRLPLRGRASQRQFVEHPQWKPVSEDTKATIKRMLREKIPLAGIARSLQLSERWLQRSVNDYYQSVVPQVEVQPKAPQRLSVQMDEL